MLTFYICKFKILIIDELKKTKINLSGNFGNLPTGYLSLRVNVLDINDNPPIFTHNEYISNLNETLDIGTEFLQVVAADPDSGKNGRLTYHIVHPDNYASHFALNPDTGWMRTRASLRCRTKRQV